MLSIPDNFVRCMVELYDAEGVAWLERLPALIAACERRWSLVTGPPFPLSYNYVAPAVQADGTNVVLKVGFPGRELMTEIEALRLYDGHGIVRLLDVDREQGSLLLERLMPGTPLAEVADDVEATSIAAGVMRKLWQGPGGTPPARHDFPSVADWAAGLGRLRDEFGGGTGPFPVALVEEAETLFAELIGSMGAPVLLHGDLHHENILAAEREPWLALDPKGVVGEAEYEVGALLRNRQPEQLAAPETGRILARRVAQLAEELGFDRTRLHGWGLAQAVLSAWWSYEDHGHGWEGAMVVAEHLSALKL